MKEIFCKTYNVAFPIFWGIILIVTVWKMDSGSLNIETGLICSFIAFFALQWSLTSPFKSDEAVHT